MKKIIAAACLAFILSGCSFTPTPPPPAEEPGVKPEYPREVQDLLTTMKTIEGGASVVVGDKTYILASRGEKPPGYGVTIEEIKTQGEQATAKVMFYSPGQTGPQDMEPMAIEVVEGRFPEVDFIDARDESDYIPRLVGLEGEYLAQGDGNIRLMSSARDAQQIRVTGIARVFEATVSYELQDDQGKTLEQGYTNAASGGPDWGYFKLEINDYPAGAAKLVIFQSSAKDGTPQDTVTINIK